MGSKAVEPSPYNKPNRDGYTPVNVVQKNGQYYNYTPPQMQMGRGIPILGKIGAEAAPQGTYTPINFGGGGNSYGGGRYGPARPYGSAQRYTSPSSSYRAPATYSQPRQQPMQQGGKGGYEAPPMGGGINYASPSFAPRNYGSLMDLPSVADTPENRAAGQQYNDQLNQRFSSKGGVSPSPQPQYDFEQASLAVMPKPQSSSQVGNLYKPNKTENLWAFGKPMNEQQVKQRYLGAASAASRVPSFDPNNPQDDAIKDPKLRKAAKQLNKQAPPGERLAFINPKEEELLKAVGGSGMTAAGGIPSYKKGDVEAPPPRDYAKETRDTLEAQVELAPDLYAKEAEFRPQYANLERGIMLENLGLDPQMGLLDAFRQVSGAQKDIQYDSTLADINMIGGLGQVFADAVRSADPRAEALRQSIMGQAEQGLATADQEFSDIAEAQRNRLVNRAGDYQPLMDRASAGLESGEEYDQLVSDAQARRESNPYAGLVRDAQEDYASGEGLTALEQRDLDQQVLAGAASRGMEDSAGTLAEQIGQRLSGNRQVRNQRRDALAQALGISDAYDRTATSDYAQALGMGEDYGRRMEQDYAGALSGRMGLEAALMGDYERALTNQQAARQQALSNAGVAYGMSNFDPLLALTGRSGTAPMMAQQGFGASGFTLDSSPGLFNPESAYAGALAGSNQQNIMDARTATAANQAGMMSGLMSGLGSFGGGLFHGRFGGK